MDIWQCSECSELVIGSVYPAEGWRFNGDCFQHDCEQIRKVIKEVGYSENYRQASEKLTGCEVLTIVDAIKAENKSLKDGQDKSIAAFGELESKFATVEAELAEAKKENWYDLYTEWRTNHNTVMTAFVDREARLTEAKAENKRLREDRQKTAKRVVGLIEGLEAERDKLRKAQEQFENRLNLANGTIKLLQAENAALKQPKGGG